MEILLDGKKVANKINEENIKTMQNITKQPYIAILGMTGNEASLTYTKKIEKKCEKYNIKCDINLSNSEEEFIKTFNKTKENKEITGIMFQQPLSKNLMELINQIPSEKDVEGLTETNMGKLFIGKENNNIPCTSKAVIEILDFYNIDLTGKNVVVVGRSNIVGKPLIPQLLNKNATVTVCHSKTKNLTNILENADVIIMAIGKAKFLKKEMIKKDAIIIDVGINFENGKMVGDVDFEDVKEKAYAITPVPGGIGVVTNSLLINNIVNTKFL